MKGKPVDLIGKKIGNLLVVGLESLTSSGKAWRCVCDCGSEIVRQTGNLLRKHTLGVNACPKCSKLNFQANHPRRSHGASNSPLHKVWMRMNHRCNNPKATQYKWYGGKGISICDAWRSFQGFMEWATESGYGDGLSIDRVNPDLNYDPSNCEWVTVSENNRRAKTNHWRAMTCNA